ncbi:MULTISPECIES: signal peptidase I [unclassified Janthinobacterium]|uniref:signal peptidase I n=1 Tax=unclassified Janthinobacterium TaxID=2610881 RepID=UPI001610685D|nr:MULTISPECIES: signal peptidase I [unclassified Janthinobacterium]MBB5607142.1 signal peptidase I [Janthinobacterium sp. S3T4]MBB5612867.1 signal peptidase I [Janthinobacterium sp. S3M3]
MKPWMRANKGFLMFLLLFGVFRTAVADWNPIPSGSMRPNLLEGDVVFVNRLAFNLKVPLTNIVLQRLGEPERGDIVTFFSPKDGTRLIKRVIALPGDTLQMRDEHLTINGRPAQYTMLDSVPETVDHVGQLTAQHISESNTGNNGNDGHAHRIQVLAQLPALRSFGPVTVPADHYLMLGDNRDNSADSRYFGFVPRELLIGKAERILVSANIQDHWQPRLQRFGMKLE